MNSDMTNSTKNTAEGQSLAIMTETADVGQQNHCSVIKGLQGTVGILQPVETPVPTVDTKAAGSSSAFTPQQLQQYTSAAHATYPGSGAKAEVGGIRGLKVRMGIASAWRPAKSDVTVSAPIKLATGAHVLLHITLYSGVALAAALFDRAYAWDAKRWNCVCLLTCSELSALHARLPHKHMRYIVSYVVLPMCSVLCAVCCLLQPLLTWPKTENS